MSQPLPAAAGADSAKAGGGGGAGIGTRRRRDLSSTLEDVRPPQRLERIDNEESIMVRVGARGAGDPAIVVAPLLAA